MATPPVTLAQLRNMIAELREDRAAESVAIVEILRKLDLIIALLREGPRRGNRKKL